MRVPRPRIPADEPRLVIGEGRIATRGSDALVCRATGTFASPPR